MEKNIKNLTFVNTTAPVDNMSFTFLIPPLTSDYTLPNISVVLPEDDKYHRYISDIDYRVDTSGIYNVLTPQTVSVPGLVPSTRIIEPGFYDIKAINGPGLLTDWVKINSSGPNAFKAIPVAGATSIDLTLAPEIQNIFNWPAFISSPSTFIPELTADLTLSKDLLLVYLSFCRQSTETNFTNVAAIPIAGTIGNTISGTVHQKTPVLANMNTISSPTIRIRDIFNRPYLIATPVLINVKILFSLKNSH
jgi:hypothetical protein